MTKHINNINRLSAKKHSFQQVETNTIEKHLNKNNNTKLLVLNLDDLNVEIINQLKAKQCKMMLLNKNFETLEEAKPVEIKHLQLKIDGCKQYIEIQNIIRFEAYSNYTNIFIKDFVKPILTSKTLKHYVNLLGENDFLRLHNKHFANIKYIKALTHNKQIKMQNGVTLPISRRKLSDVKQLMNNKRIT